MAMAITDNDIKRLKKEFKKDFATKEDLKEFEGRVMSKLDAITNYTQTATEELVITQSKVNNHESRLQNIESHLNLTPSN